MYRRRIVRAALTLAALFSSACTRQLYDGPPLPASDVAVVHVGQTSVLNIDGRFGFAIPLGTRRFELAPGPHRVILAFERPATTIGVRDVPAQRGEGTCTLDFVAEAGAQYWLGSRAVGADWTMQRWDGKWEGWIRDPSVSAADDIVARCSSRAAGEEPAPRARRTGARPRPSPRRRPPPRRLPHRPPPRQRRPRQRRSRCR
jgi:hypothetical protein